MLKHLSSAAILVTLAISGCSSESTDGTDKNTLAFNDFDQMEGWVGELPGLVTLSKVKAHSTPYSTSVFPGSDYSLGFNNSLSKITGQRPSKITVSAWVYVPDNKQNARLVAEIKEPGVEKGLSYNALELRTVVKDFNKWERVEQTFDVPATATPNSRLIIYMWRAESTAPVYLDDMQISLPK